MSMKPSKSRQYCLDCGKMKTVFNSEGAAKKFIEYNSEDILNEGGYAPTRVYYCDMCCGWHVTHTHEYRGTSTSRRAVDFLLDKRKGEKAIWDYLRDYVDTVISAIYHIQHHEPEQAYLEYNKLALIWEKVHANTSAKPKNRAKFKECGDLLGRIVAGDEEDSKLIELIRDVASVTRCYYMQLGYKREQVGMKIVDKENRGQHPVKVRETKVFLCDLDQQQLQQATKRPAKASEKYLKSLEQKALISTLDWMIERTFKFIADEELSKAKEEISKMLDMVASVECDSQRQKYIDDVTRLVKQYTEKVKS